MKGFLDWLVPVIAVVFTVAFYVLVSVGPVALLVWFVFYLIKHYLMT